VLWAGVGSILSHDTAGYLLGLVDREPSEVHVAISEQRRLVAPVGVVLHRTSHPDTDPRRRPPQTTVERTTLDLVSAASTADEVVAVVSKVLQGRMTSEHRLIDALSHTPNLRWKRLLRELLDPQLDGVRSPLEWRYACNVERAHGLPRARRQVVVASAGSKTIRDVDYEEFGVVVELDGRIGHREGHAFRDMARDNRTAEMGEMVLRYGWVDVTTRPCLVAGQLARVLALRGWDGRPQVCRPGCLAGRR
jgi:very-short-patch-repair endonuclease